MKCNMCGKENTKNYKVCTHCGESREKVSKVSSTRTQEIVLLVTNFILQFFITWSLMLIVGIVDADFALDLIFLVFNILTYGTAFFFSGMTAQTGMTAKVARLAGTTGISFLVILLLFNIAMGFMMYKRNKRERSKGRFKEINKIEYIVLAVFFGIFGVHRFAIKDYYGGALRLILIIVGLPIIGILSVFTSFDMLSYLIFVLIGISMTLTITDITIGLSKVPNKKHLISI